MASIQVEAGSLSSLIDLANNPPTEPRAPLADLTPLVLYIARVPGSKDIFLTPLKPKDKVVSAQDIESSLYYLHVHCADDERIRKSLSHESLMSQPPLPPPHRLDPKLHPSQPANLLRQENRLPAPSHPLPPLPSGNDFGSWSNFPPPGSLNRQRRPSDIAVRRKPIASVNSTPSALSPRDNFSNQHNIHAKSYSPSLLSPNSAISSRTPLSPPYPDHELFPDVANWLPQNPRIPSPLRSEFLEGDVMPPSQDRHDNSLGLLSPRNVFHEDSVSYNEFTLIRRDPGTGSQWNVARIRNHQAPTHALEHSTFPKEKPWVEMVLGTPGYEKFPSNQVSPAASGTHLPISPQGTFRRALRIGDIELPDDTTVARKGSSDDEGHPSRIYVNDGRRGSEHINASRISLASGSSSNSKLVLRKSARKTGYNFLSPWNGRCEFSTGLGNSSLKCKHSLRPTLLSSETDPPHQVSELRFNLPSGGSSNAHKHNTDENKPRRSRLFHRHREDDVLSHGRRGSEPAISGTTFDLSLGQELAGGGFGGKQAKLGKLIIEPEGLKMMDLVVAANLGLWWKAYNR